MDRATTCVFPPLTYKITGFFAPVTARPISMCPTQWFTATIGLFHRRESVRAATAQEVSGPPMPGPRWEGNAIQTFGKTDDIDIANRNTGDLNSILHKRNDVRLVVPGSLTGQKPRTRRRNKRFTNIGQDLTVGPITFYNTDTTLIMRSTRESHFICTPLYPQCDNRFHNRRV